jgi:glycosyltransferase involved in cell wall biosynthesis
MLKRKLAIEDLDYFLQISTVRRLVREIRPDILHAHYLTSFGFLAACSGWRPFVVTALGTDILITPFKSIPHRVLTRFVLRRADLVIADAQISASRMEELGIGKEKVVTIPSGIDPKIFYPEGRKDSLPTLLSVRDHKPVYNLDVVLRAIGILSDQRRDVKLLLAGDGPLRSELEDLAGRTQIGDNVEFLGRIPHEALGDVYRKASIYLSIPRSDATSISLLEAMACGAFPIASDIPANREWITDGKNGFLVPFGDPAKLAQRISQALDDPDLRLTAQKANWAIIEERALWDKNMETVENLYFRLLENG